MITAKTQTDITQNLEEENFSEIFEFFNNLNFNKFNVQKERFTNSPITIELFFNTKTNKVVFGGNTDDCIMKIELVIWNQKNIEDGKQTKLEIKFSEILADKNNAKLRNEFNQLLLKSAKTKFLIRYKKEVKYLFDKPNHKIFWKDFVNKKIPINFLDKNSTMDLLREHHYFAFSKAEEEKASEVIKNYILDYWTESELSSYLCNEFMKSNPEIDNIIEVESDIYTLFLNKIIYKLPKSTLKRLLPAFIKECGDYVNTTNSFLIFIEITYLTGDYTAIEKLISSNLKFKEMLIKYCNCNSLKDITYLKYLLLK